MEIQELDEIIQQTQEISDKLKSFKELAKSLKKEKEKKPRERTEQPIIKTRKIKEDQKLYRGGLSLFQYKQSAISAGFSNPPEVMLKDVIKDLYEPKPKPPKAPKQNKKIKKLPEEGGAITQPLELLTKQQNEELRVKYETLGGHISIKE